MAPNNTTFANTGLAPGTTYYYVVRSDNSYGTSANTAQASATTLPGDIIVDNASSGFTASSNWSTSTWAADKYGSDYHYRNAAALSDSAQWSFTVPATRNYEILAWWNVSTNRSTTAPYVLPDNTTVKCNQQANGGKWNSLGTKSLTAGTANVKLSCWTTTGFIVVADAVKVVAK